MKGIAWGSPEENTVVTWEEQKPNARKAHGGAKKEARTTTEPELFWSLAGDPRL